MAAEASTSSEALDIRLEVTWSGVRDQHSNTGSWLDTFAVYSVSDGPDRAAFRELDRSKPGKDCAAVFATSYRFGETHLLLFELFSVNRISKANEPLGRAVCGAVDMLVYLDTPYVRSLVDRKGAKVPGSITVLPRAVSHPGGFVALEFSARSLPVKKLFRSSDPMLELCAQDGNAVLVTEVVSRNRTPRWKPQVVNSDRFPGGVLKARCYDVSLTGERTFVGQATVLLDEVEVGTVLPLDAPEVAAAGLEPSSADERPSLLVERCRQFPWTLIDYLHGDFSLHFAFIIDLSSSNGDLRAGSDMRREYESVIFAFDEVVQQFDEDQLLPALAFGARTSAGLISQPYVFLSAKDELRVNGVQGVLEAYAKGLERLFSSEPSELGPALTYVAQLAQPAHYYVALVLTDGRLDYGLSTLDCLSKASACAMSVVFLVIGEEGCSRALRRDLLSRRQAGLRECVHVVEVAPYRERLHLLPREALVAVPEQVMQYLALHDVEPVLGVQ
ncbi:copine-4 [Rhipicephalus sanguineus]|uniref:copine-4 n=1 Tax=Rhipicephalus sanguineus TaxID=34632 RepID=UPI001893B6C2|nr:copine-4 [Rhipicephalus sanguineus]